MNFNLKDFFSKSTKYPDEVLGFTLDMQLGFIKDMIDFQEKTYLTLINEFEQQVKNREFIIETDKNGYEIENTDQKQIIEASIDSYRHNSRKLILILLISFFEEHMLQLYESFLKDSQIKDTNKNRKDRGIIRYRKYFNNDVKINEKDFINSIETIIKLRELRDFYVHPAKEKELRSKIDSIINMNKSFKLKKFYNLNGRNSVYIEDDSLLENLIIKIDQSIRGISNELSKKRNK